MEQCSLADSLVYLCRQLVLLQNTMPRLKSDESELPVVHLPTTLRRRKDPTSPASIASCVGCQLRNAGQNLKVRNPSSNNEQGNYSQYPIQSVSGLMLRSINECSQPQGISIHVPSALGAIPKAQLSYGSSDRH